MCFGLCQTLCQFRPKAEGLLLFRHRKNLNRKKKIFIKIEMLWWELARWQYNRTIQTSNPCSFNKKLLCPQNNLLLKPSQQSFVPLYLWILVPGGTRSCTMLASFCNWLHVTAYLQLMNVYCNYVHLFTLQSWSLLTSPLCFNTAILSPQLTKLNRKKLYKWVFYSVLQIINLSIIILLTVLGSAEYC